MSSKTKLVVVVGLSLTLLVASYAPCGEDRTGVPCTSDEMCKALCFEKKAGYTGGRCSVEFVVGDPSCVCRRPCARQAVMAAAGGEAPVEKKAAATTAGRSGMEDARLI